MTDLSEIPPLLQDINAEVRAERMLAFYLQAHAIACRLGLHDGAKQLADDWWELMLDSWDWDETVEEQMRGERWTVHGNTFIRCSSNYYVVGHEYAEEKRLDDRERARDFREALR